MKEILLSKGLVVAVILLFLGTCINPTVANDSIEQSSISTSKGQTLYVGGSGEGNYTMIQEAIENASDEDTVFVYDYSSPYYENIVMDKSINLIGENRDTTIIDSKGENSVVQISKGNANIFNFSLRNSSMIYSEIAGITITSNKNIIENCNIYSNKNGIFLGYNTKENIINFCKIFSNRGYGIKSEWSDKNIVQNCFISNNTIGIDLTISEKWTISNNEFIKNGIGFSGYVFTNVPEVRFNPFNHTIENNTVNGKPMLHFKNQNNIYLEGTTAGQIIIVNCSNVEIKNLTISDTNTPIINAFGEDIQITNCTLFSKN